MATTIAKRVMDRLRGARPPLVSVVKLSGAIAATARLTGGLNLESLAPVLERAFSVKHVKAVALAINSPGGSPAQSMLIHGRIRALASEKNLPVYAFAEDVAASGGYMLACAADQIYVTESSIIGSIGVIAATFGFEKLIERAGIERRVYTAGARKGLLDPFKPVDPEDIRRLQLVQEDIHESFKTLVRQHRGARLQGPEDDLFSGEFWVGRRAVTLGLADGIGDLRGEMRKRFGPDVEFRVVAPERRLGWRRRPAAASPALPLRLGPGAWFDDVLAHLEARAIWSRFGL